MLAMTPGHIISVILNVCSSGWKKIKSKKKDFLVKIASWQDLSTDLNKMDRAKFAKERKE